MSLGPGSTSRAAATAAGAAPSPPHAASVLAAGRASAVPGVDESTDTDEDVGLDLPWDVIVWDDPVNLMAHVVHIFRKVLGVDEAVARRLMLEVHNEGRSLVASEPRSTAERYVRELHAHGLHATMRRST